MRATVCGWNKFGLESEYMRPRCEKQAGEKQLGSRWTELTCAWVPPFSVRGALRQGWKWREGMKKVGREEFGGLGGGVVSTVKRNLRDLGVFSSKKKNARFKLKLGHVSPSQDCKTPRFYWWLVIVRAAKIDGKFKARIRCLSLKITSLKATISFGLWFASTETEPQISAFTLTILKVDC